VNQPLETERDVSRLGDARYEMAATRGWHRRVVVTTDPVTVIADLIDGKGERNYGLSLVNQRAHALQAACLAEQAGCTSALITAALLHDIGHMVHDLGEDPAAAGVDDQHEALGEAFLARYFGPDVTEPVRLHVAAKRYLCGVEPDYFAKLSDDSIRSLTLQGGRMSPEEASAFAALPGAQDAVQLRRFDEGSKVRGRQTPPVAHFLPHLRRCLRPGI
jgi:[1-hydroxy-2-(trimethylamino)ethyl]phosphonate dioxygenase